MNNQEEKPVSQICADTEKLTQLLTALTECMETGEFDRASACIHELTLKNGRRCQVIIEIEEDTGIENLVLSGIFWNRTKPSALLNDQVVGIGSPAGNFTVAEIKYNKVIVGDGVNTYELTLRTEYEQEKNIDH